MPTTAPALGGRCQPLGHRGGRRPGSAAVARANTGAAARTTRGCRRGDREDAQQARDDRARPRPTVPASSGRRSSSRRASELDGDARPERDEGEHRPRTRGKHDALDRAARPRWAGRRTRSTADEAGPRARRTRFWLWRSWDGTGSGGAVLPPGAARRDVRDGAATGTATGTGRSSEHLREHAGAAGAAGTATVSGQCGHRVRPRGAATACLPRPRARGRATALALARGPARYAGGFRRRIGRRPRRLADAEHSRWRLETPASPTGRAETTLRTSVVARRSADNASGTTTTGDTSTGRPPCGGPNYTSRTRAPSPPR